MQCAVGNWRDKRLCPMTIALMSSSNGSCVHAHMAGDQHQNFFKKKKALPKPFRRPDQDFWPHLALSARSSSSPKPTALAAACKLLTSSSLALAAASSAGSWQGTHLCQRGWVPLGFTLKPRWKGKPSKKTRRHTHTHTHKQVGDTFWFSRRVSLWLHFETEVKGKPSKRPHTQVGASVWFGGLLGVVLMGSRKGAVCLGG